MHSGKEKKKTLQATEKKPAAPCVVGETHVCTLCRTTVLVGLSDRAGA